MGLQKPSPPEELLPPEELEELLPPEELEELLEEKMSHSQSTGQVELSAQVISVGTQTPSLMSQGGAVSPSQARHSKLASQPAPRGSQPGGIKTQ